MDITTAPAEDEAHVDAAAAETPAASLPVQDDPVPAGAEQGEPDGDEDEDFVQPDAPVENGFAELGLSPEIVQAVGEKGYLIPTPIQAQAIPTILMGRDVLGCAQTGTGKTASFVLPMLDILSGSRARARMPRSLILEPTRELALQVAENFVLYGKHLKLNHALLIGGESLSDQKEALMRGVDVLIATPGRLMDLFERGGLLLTDTSLLVIDEADRMLDMGFIPDVEKIVGFLPRTRQTLFFSATMAPEIRRLADAFLQNPKEITVSRPASVASTIVRRVDRGGGAGQARGAATADQGGRRAERADLLQPQARRGHLVQVVEAAWLQRRFAAWRHEPAGAVRDAGQVQGQRNPPAGVQRRGGPGAGHWRIEPRVQLRRADPCRGLRPPDRPHWPRRDDWPRLHAGVAGRCRLRGGDRETGRRADPAHRGGGVRPGGVHARRRQETPRPRPLGAAGVTRGKGEGRRRRHCQAAPQPGSQARGGTRGGAHGRGRAAARRGRCAAGGRPCAGDGTGRRGTAPGASPPGSLAGTRPAATKPRRDAQRREEPRLPEPRRDDRSRFRDRGRRDPDLGPAVMGFGDETPAFMLLRSRHGARGVAMETDQG